MAERGEYRPIARVLIDGKDFRKLSERARSVFVFLKINMGPAGIEIHYAEALANQLSEQTGMPVPAVKRALAELEQAGWIAREANIVWVIEQLRYDPHMDAKNENHRKGIQRHLAGLPRLAIVRAFVSHYPDFCNGMAMPLEGPANAMAITEYRIPNTIPNTTTPPAGARTHTRLAVWLGERGDVLDRMTASAPHSSTWQDAIYGLYGPEGTDPTIWSGVPPDQQPALVAKAIDRYAGEGQPYKGNFFRGILLKVINERNGSTNTGRAGATPRAATGTTDQSARRNKPLGYED